MLCGWPECCREFTSRTRKIMKYPYLGYHLVEIVGKLGFVMVVALSEQPQGKYSMRFPSPATINC